MNYMIVVIGWTKTSKIAKLLLKIYIRSEKIFIKVSFCLLLIINYLISLILVFF